MSSTPQSFLAQSSGQGDRPLGADEIHLYFSYPDQVSDTELLRAYRSLLSNDESDRLSQFHFDHNRQQYLVSRALLRTTLSSYHAHDPADWCFVKNAYGKPEIDEPAAGQSLCFNLSHTRGMSVCAIGRNHVIGVDLEDSRRNVQSGFGSLASYFSPSEVEELRSLPEELQRNRFYDYWTLKEAYIKARGAGFAIPLDQFSFRFQANELRGFSTEPDLHDRAESWQFWRIHVGAHYRIALAVQSEGRRLKVTAIASVPLMSEVPVRLNIL